MHVCPGRLTHTAGDHPTEDLPSAERGRPQEHAWSVLGESFKVACDLRVGILAAPGQVRSPELPVSHRHSQELLCTWAGGGAGGHKVASHAGESGGFTILGSLSTFFSLCRQLCSQQPIPFKWVSQVIYWMF